ncbi:MAG: VOC family protein [Mucilaginibacter polytrichastri]|nr:VOC family protein [Mucilaginibacter polytrichastri]
MSKLHPYLFFNRNCEEAFLFYQSVFGGELNVNRYSESPPNDNFPPLSDEQKKLIMNVSLPINKDTMLMGSDPHPGMGDVSFGQNFSLCFEANSREHANEIYTKLSAGGNPSMPMNDTFWGAYFGMLNDKFGIGWMVSFTPENAG